MNINVQKGFGEVSRKLDLLNAQQYLEVRHEAFKNDGFSYGPADHDLNGNWDTTRSTDWQDILLGGTAKYTDVQGSVSGGTNNFQFRIGANYHHETSVFPGTSANQKGSMHFNITTVSLNQKFHLEFSGSFMADRNRLLYDDLTSMAMRIAPVAPPLYNADGSLNWAPDAHGNSTFPNPLSYTVKKYYNKTNNSIGNLNVGYAILPGLELKAGFGYTNLQSDESQLLPLSALAPEQRSTGSRVSTFANSTITSWSIEPQITYERIIGRGKIELLAGSSIQQRTTEGRVVQGTGFSSDLLMLDIGSATSQQAGTVGAAIYKYSGVFGRIKYIRNSKYLLDLTARRDGSSRFGPENQIHNFGAVGAGWIFF